MYKSLNSKQRDVMIVCMLKANHKGTEWEWKGKIYKASPGEFVTSIQSIVEMCGRGLGDQSAKTALNKLKMWNFLTDEVTTQGRLIRIVNWAQYQGDDVDTNKQTNRRLTDDQPTTNRRVTTNKNDKNVKNEKNIQTPLPPSGDAGSGSDPVVVKEQTVLQRPAGNTEHEIGHYIIELFRDINPDTRRLHALKTEMNAALTLYKTGVYGDLTKMENAIRLLPQLATGKYCPKEIKLISKPSQMLTYWALYCSYAKGIKEDINNSGPLIL